MQEMRVCVEEQGEEPEGVSAVQEQVLEVRTKSDPWRRSNHPKKWGGGYLWNNTELELFRKSYPDRTMQELLTLFPLHSKSAIINKARRFKLHKTKRTLGRINSKWSEDELETLRTYYLKVPNRKMTEFLPSKDENTIRLKANRMGLRKRARSLTPKLDMSSNLAYIIGVVLGDGYLGKQGNSNTIVLASVTEKFNIEFKEALEKIGLHPNIDTHQDNRPNHQLRYRTRAFSKKFYQWFKSLSFTDMENLLSMDREFIKAFIKGFYESEGCFQYKEYKRGSKIQRTTSLSIANTNRDLILLVQRLAKKLGFDLKLYKRFYQVKGQQREIYNLRTTKRSKALNFLQVVQPCIKTGRFS